MVKRRGHERKDERRFTSGRPTPFGGPCSCRRIAETYLKNVNVLLAEGNAEGENLAGVGTRQTGPSLRGFGTGLTDVVGSCQSNEAKERNSENGTRHFLGGETHHTREKMSAL